MYKKWTSYLHHAFADKAFAEMTTSTCMYVYIYIYIYLSAYDISFEIPDV